MDFMSLVYALPLLIALGFASLAVRHVLEKRRERRLRERLRRRPIPPKIKSRGNSERSEMRAGEDTTTVLQAIEREEPAMAARSRAPRPSG